MRKLLLLLLLLLPLLTYAKDSTYVANGTTYYANRFYKNGAPMVKRSASARAAFIKSKGFKKIPKGYEVDHIIPLHWGGLDTPENMQLITVEEHKIKTKKERYNPYFFLK